MPGSDQKPHDQKLDDVQPVAESTPELNSCFGGSLNRHVESKSKPIGYTRVLCTALHTRDKNLSNQIRFCMSSDFDSIVQMIAIQDPAAFGNLFGKQLGFAKSIRPIGNQ